MQEVKSQFLKNSNTKIFAQGTGQPTHIQKMLDINSSRWGERDQKKGQRHATAANTFPRGSRP